MLTPEQRTQVAVWVKAGPYLDVDGVVRWRRVDLAAKVSTEFGVTLAERTVGELLQRMEQPQR